MANEDQLSILKEGINAWNKWRNKSLGVVVDLNEACLDEANLCGVDLHNVKLRRVKLRGADLRNAFLNDADLGGADLRKARLNGSYFVGANLCGAMFSKADLNHAHLGRADLRKTDFHRVDLRGADLRYANLQRASLFETSFIGACLIGVDLRESILWQVDFRGADLRGADLGEASLKNSNFWRAAVGSTNFGSLDLNEAIGLEEVNHYAPSLIGMDTISKAKGKIPEVFLRGCGLSDWEIELAKLYNPDLSNAKIKEIQNRMYDMRSTRAFQISPLFISYSHGDSEFVDRLGTSLEEKGVRYWLDIHDMKAGRIEKQIDGAIRDHRTVLLVLSENSLKSDWVQHEVREAREVEKEFERDVLCPIALDDSWKLGRWPERIMEQIKEYNILDFSAWKDDGEFEKMFRKLLDGLEKFYKV